MWLNFFKTTLNNNAILHKKMIAKHKGCFTALQPSPAKREGPFLRLFDWLGD